MFLRTAQNLFEAGIRVRKRLGHDALVTAALAHVVKLATRDGFHRHVELACLAQDVFDLPVLLEIIRQHDALHGHLRTKRLDDRTFSFYVISHSFVSHSLSH